MRKVREQVCLGDDGGGAADAAGGVEHDSAQLGEDALFDLDGAVVRGENLALVLF